MALGAHRGDVFKLIMKQGMLQTAFALGLGLFVSLGAGRVLAQMLYRGKSNGSDRTRHSRNSTRRRVITRLFFPARRATRVSPMTALRTEVNLEQSFLAAPDLFPMPSLQHILDPQFAGVLDELEM